MSEHKSSVLFKIVRVSHLILAIFLGMFFVYAGIKKFIPKPAKPVNNEEFIKAFEENRFESPLTFKMGIKALRASNFILMVGVLQILSGLLILIPSTRLIGLLMLLPVVVNVFCFHFFMDNRADENVETGLLLALNIFLAAFYHKQLKELLIRTWSFRLKTTV